VHRPVSMVNPAHRDAFLNDVRDAIAWAKKLNVPQIIVLSGNQQPGMTRETQHASMVEGGQRAAELAGQGGVTLSEFVEFLGLSDLRFSPAKPSAVNSAEDQSSSEDLRVRLH
jgi:hydroxypyruvate isomerase